MMLKTLRRTMIEKYCVTVFKVDETKERKFYEMFTVDHTADTRTLFRALERVEMYDRARVDYVSSNPSGGLDVTVTYKEDVCKEHARG